MKSKINLPAIIVFYAIAIICRFVAVKTELFAGIENGYLQILIRGLGPALGALAAFTIFKIPNTMSLKGIYKNGALPIVIYWVMPIALISGVEYFKNGTFPALLIVTVLAYGLLEEIGWRGFLQEQLKDLPKIYSILIIGVLWFVWHLNLSMEKSNMFFLIIIFFGTWGIGKVYDKTHSLLAVAAVHSLNNFFRNGIAQDELIMIVIMLTVWILFVWRYGKNKSVENATENC